MDDRPPMPESSVSPLDPRAESILVAEMVDGPSPPDPSRAGPSRAGPSRAGPSRAGSSRSGPRWWTPFAICGISLACFLSASFVMTILAFIVVHGTIDLGLLRSEAGFTEVMASRLGLVMMLVVPQLALVTPPIVAAVLSPVATRERLGLVRGHWPLWVWLAAAAATPLIGLVSGIAVSLLMDESQMLNELATVFRNHGHNGFLIPLALLVGMTPAFCEELLFRGYMQTRLTRSLGPVAGILICSILFAAFHMDLVHTAAVLPLGLYLGWITWQSGSLFPAMLGHFINNTLSVVLLVFDPHENPDVLAAPAIAFTAAILALGATGMAAVCYAAVVYRPLETPRA